MTDDAARIGSDAERQLSCDERVESHRASRESGYRFLFADTLPPATEDPVGARAFITWVQAEDLHELADDETGLVEMFDATRNPEDPADLAWADILVPEAADDSSIWYGSDYAGQTLGDAMDDFLENLAAETRDDRVEKVGESVLSADLRITLRVDLSTGGPADYLTADWDPQDRSIGEVTYHFADWFDHASRPVESGSPLVALVEYFAEVVSLPESDR